MKKRIIVLGSTGSIGRSFLNILKKDANNCEILLLTINRNILELLKQLKVFKVKNIIDCIGQILFLLGRFIMFGF